MSERSLRRRIPVSNRKAKPSYPSPSSHGHRRTSAGYRRAPKPSKPIEIPQRWNTEPNLWTVGFFVGGDEHRGLTMPDSVLSRPQTCIDIFSSPELLTTQSPQNFEGYSKEAKVVVNVTVEGSPGPIRAMVKLGSSVEETIRHVINKYSEEGRSPQLDKEAASTFELHHSYFSLECLNKSDVIGDVGSRSFYLRRGNGGDMASESFTSEIVLARASTAPTLTVLPTPSLFFLPVPAFFSRKINKIIRRTRKLWKILGCMHCSG